MLISLLKGPPYNLFVEPHVERDGYQTIVPIAGTEDALLVVSVVSSLVKGHVPDGSYWDFAFLITVDFLNGGGEPFRTADRQIAAEFIPDGSRGEVMEVVRQSLCSLVETAKPLFVGGVAFEQHSILGAVRKYYFLINALEALGYLLERTDIDSGGRRFWVLRRGTGT